MPGHQRRATPRPFFRPNATQTIFASILLIITTLLAFTSGPTGREASAAVQYDVVIRNGLVVDGTGRAAFNADGAVNGRVPYRDFPVEYPILAFPIFLIPRLFASTTSGYRIALGTELLLFNAAAVLALSVDGVAPAAGTDAMSPLAVTKVSFALLAGKAA